MTGVAPSAERGSSFSLGFWALPRAKREALSAVYAYCRLIDDVVDAGTLPRDEARRTLDVWREEIERLCAGRATHPVARALQGPVAAYRIPKNELLEVIRGCALDLEGTRYETAAELEGYMRGVASSVGVMCVSIFGWRHTSPERMREFAILFGYAFQLTNIVRDVGADLDLSRVYLPLADLRAAGCPPENLAARERTPAFLRAMETQHARAKDYYRRARSLVDARDRPSLLPAEVMAHVYEGLLDEIRRQGYPVLSRRVRLSGPRKLSRALRAWLYCHGF